MHLEIEYKNDFALNNLQCLICHKTQPNQTKSNLIYLIYMYEEEMTLNNLEWLICHKTKPNQTKPNQTKSYIFEIYIMWRGIKYLSQDGSLFFTRVKSRQSGTWSLATISSG